MVLSLENVVFIKQNMKSYLSCRRFSLSEESCRDVTRLVMPSMESDSTGD